MASSKEYNKQYWKDNRPRLLAERAKRYREDPAFRKAAIARSRARVAVNRLFRAGVVKMVLHAGQKEKQRTFSYLCAKANRSQDVIYRWRQRGILPQPTYRDSRQNGVYADSQVKLVQVLCHMVEKENLHITYDDMSKILHHFWPRTWSDDALRNYIAKEIHDEDGKEKGDYVTKTSRRCSGNHRDSRRPHQEQPGPDSRVRRGAGGHPSRDRKHAQPRKLPKPAGVR